MPGSKEKIRTKPHELDGWWEIVGAGTLLQHEGLKGNYKIIPAKAGYIDPDDPKKDRPLEGNVNLVYRPQGHMSSDGSARLAGNYRTVENYEVRGNLANTMNMKDGTSVSVIVPEGLYVAPSNIPEKQIQPTTRREKAFESTAATHEIMGQHINFNLKPEKGEDPTPAKGTKFGPDTNIYNESNTDEYWLEPDGTFHWGPDPKLQTENEKWVTGHKKMSIDEMGSAFFKERNETPQTIGEDWGSGLVGSGDPSVGHHYDTKDKSRLSKRLPLGDRKGTLLPWAFMKI
jgi:hypothetical protein